MKKHGFDISYLKVDEKGYYFLRRVEEMPLEMILLISMMHGK